MANSFPGSGLAYADQFAVGRSSGTGLLNTFLSNDPTTNQVRIETDNSSVLTYIGISAGTMEYYRGANTSGTLKFQTKVQAASSANAGGAIVFSPNGTASDYTPVERMRILMNGNVGIGTDVPSSILHTLQTSAGSAVTGLLIQNVGSSANTAVSLNFAPHENATSPTTLAKISAIRTAATNAPTDLAFHTYNDGISPTGLNERMRITSAGNVGIGTSSPTNFGAGYTVLAIDGSGGGGAIDMMQAGTRKMTIAVDSDGPKFETKVDGDPIKFKTNSGGTIAERVRITSSGSVGIGTSTPSASLSVASSGANGILLDQSLSDATTSARVFFKNNSSGIAMLYDATGLNFCVGAVVGTTSGTTKVTINNSGSVCINTTSAGTYKLNVNGTFYSAGSSLEYKTEISTLDTDTNKILELRPVTYQYKDEYKHLGKELKSGTQIGLIAEEVAEVFPELAMMKEDEDGETRVRNVDYEKLSILLLSEVQKLRKEVNELKNK